MNPRGAGFLAGASRQPDRSRCSGETAQSIHISNSWVDFSVDRGQKSRWEQNGDNHDSEPLTQVVNPPGGRFGMLRVRDAQDRLCISGSSKNRFDSILI